MLELERRASVDVTHLEIPAELALVFSKQPCKFRENSDFSHCSIGSGIV